MIEFKRANTYLAPRCRASKQWIREGLRSGSNIRSVPQTAGPEALKSAGANDGSYFAASDANFWTQTTLRSKNVQNEKKQKTFHTHTENNRCHVVCV